ncbi:hypothetical protein K488DRAFT_69042 [Vararia minispora EC-137]|uniref:Uncharacterized protein n=1 Tax=Vararia minispora EC-137 TaxID=1314806 RepID=A0ACB8QSB0_9AGAM|nr:hypothetical protein K488DRAFT_69042 [Vararia minispora EC-137]
MSNPYSSYNYASGSSRIYAGQNMPRSASRTDTISHREEQERSSYNSASTLTQSPANWSTPSMRMSSESYGQPTGNPSNTSYNYAYTSSPPSVYGEVDGLRWVPQETHLSPEFGSLSLHSPSTAFASAPSPPMHTSDPASSLYVHHTNHSASVSSGYVPSHSSLGLTQIGGHLPTSRRPLSPSQRPSRPVYEQSTTHQGYTEDNVDPRSALRHASPPPLALPRPHPAARMAPDLLPGSFPQHGRLLSQQQHSARGGTSSFSGSTVPYALPENTLPSFVSPVAYAADAPGGAQPTHYTSHSSSPPKTASSQYAGGGNEMSDFGPDSSRSNDAWAALNSIGSPAEPGDSRSRGATDVQRRTSRTNRRSSVDKRVASPTGTWEQEPAGGADERTRGNVWTGVRQPKWRTKEEFLRAHNGRAELTRDGDKWRCSCGSTYSRKDSAVRHTNWSMNYCDKGCISIDKDGNREPLRFVREDALRRHLKDRHGEDVE